MVLSLAGGMTVFGDLGAAPPTGRPKADHKLNNTPPYYFYDLPRAGMRLIFCDKPRIAGGYANVVQLVERLCASQLTKKKAKKVNVAAIMISEIAHVSDQPLEPDHMLVKLILASDSSIPQAIPAHVYVIDHVPRAKYDTADVSWKDPEDLLEHEAWALRESQRLLVDSIGAFIPASP
ncbi:uncharacterized protein C8Q71DRAFT_7860 [Rhodofomes roseus]|uniref:Uncharacterized protein n=1 Tax=Rhodofomes roseus TaxID=34475 RepID=A0ABQ8KWG3_9APHY|nr:uncharacterized protein C8Q71DRAFT_7860 [Rhodofomes roseus]KAH9843630.1 hypothetical protein C8Q71DRAFT_7860 [Rhodofomes roseus]